MRTFEQDARRVKKKKRERLTKIDDHLESSQVQRNERQGEIYYTYPGKEWDDQKMEVAVVEEVVVEVEVEGLGQ